jgi:SAM-dependent methyltransferase
VQLFETERILRENPLSIMCRLCEAILPKTPVFVLKAAPAGAQLFRDRDQGHSSPIRLEVFECSGCGLIQLACTPVPYYRTAITAAGISEEMRRFRLDQFTKWSTEFVLHGRKVVDIGAGMGVFTDLLAAAGMDAIGLDGGAKNDTTLAGNPLFCAYPESILQLPLAPFRGAICINFLEHAPRPLEFLRIVAASLEPGGTAIIEVPAFEHMIEAGLSYDWVADHLSYFDARTLRIALELAGFDVLRTERVWHGFDWAATAVRRHAGSFETMRVEFDAAVNRLRSLVAEGTTHGHHVAVWGASHQALTLLTACEFSSRDVEFILDSAPFKQGKLAPGCGLPVVSPKELQKMKIDRVIIIAGGFSKEIARQLRVDIGYRKEAFIFRGAVEAEIVS